MSSLQRSRILGLAAFAAMAATSSTYAVVQDFNHARGADGYTLTNASGDISGTFDGQEFQPAPSTPGIQGEFFFVGAGLGQPFDLDAHAPLGQGVTATANDHGGYLLLDYKGASGGPFYWYGGMGNDAGRFPGIVLVGGNVPPGVPPLSQVLGYADVLAPAGKPFRYYINSPYDGQDHQLSFSGVGTGAWQTVGGALSSATPVNGGVVYSNLPYSTPNEMAMTVQFASEIASWDNGPSAGPAVLRIDNLTFTPASVTWAGTTGGNWSDNSKWAPLLAGGIPIAPSGRNAVAIFGPSSAPQTVTLDSPVIAPWTTSGGGDVPYQNSFYAGTIQFNSSQSYTLAGTEPLQIDTTAANGVDLSGPVGLIQVVAGSHAISAPVILRRSTTLDVSSGNTLTLSGTVSVFSDNGTPVGLTKSGTGVAVMKNARLTGGLAVNAGTLRIAQNGGDTGVSVVGQLSVAGALDLTDNDLVVNNGNYTAIRDLVLSGFGGPGPGITSSTSDGSQILALFDNAIIGATDWQGLPIGANAVVGKYTYFGDVNFDGQVTGDDYTIIDSNLNTTPPVGFEWLSGDANLDGIVTGDDYTTIDSNLGLGSGNPLTPASLSGTAVPEPAAMSVVLAAAALLPARRRRT